MESIGGTIKALCSDHVRADFKVSFVNDQGRVIRHYGHHSFLDLARQPRLSRLSRQALSALPWFDETLLGDHIHADELRFIIQAVAATADQWDDRLKQMFGGATHQEMLSGRAVRSTPTTKPGSGGGYL